MSGLIPGLGPQSEQKRDDRTVLVSAIIATAAIIGLAVTILSANLPNGTRFILLLSVPLLYAALFVAVLSGPFNRFWANHKIRSKANDIARHSMDTLIDFSDRFRRIVQGGSVDCLLDPINRINKDGRLTVIHPYFFTELAAKVRYLGEHHRSFQVFRELVHILYYVVREFNDRINPAVEEIRASRTRGEQISEREVAAYRVARLRYMTSWKNLGGSVKESNLSSGYALTTTLRHILSTYLTSSRPTNYRLLGYLKHISGV